MSEATRALWTPGNDKTFKYSDVLCSAVRRPLASACAQGWVIVSPVQTYFPFSLPCRWLRTTYLTCNPPTQHAFARKWDPCHSDRPRPPVGA